MFSSDSNFLLSYFPSSVDSVDMEPQFWGRLYFVCATF